MTASLEVVSKVASCKLVIFVPFAPARVKVALFEPVSYKTVSALPVKLVNAVSSCFLLTASVSAVPALTLVICFSAPARPTEMVSARSAKESKPIAVALFASAMLCTPNTLLFWLRAILPP